MNKPKTIVMYNQNIVTPSNQIEHEDTETVDQYVYLGQLVYMNGTREKELK